MSIKLRELIRAVRACKTAQEERAVIAKECALIRTAFKENNTVFRHRNVAKLLFINMLGYPSHFGQMECVKLIASPNFPEKRIGYLALMLLLDERTEVLTLVTNSLKLDLEHSSQFIIGLALTSVGNLATSDMARTLIVDVAKHLGSTNPYVRKKAALAMIRVLKRVPEFAEDYVDRVVGMLKDRSHGVLIAAVQLMIEVLQLEAENNEPSPEEPSLKERFGRVVPSLVKMLRNLLNLGYSPEHDIAGIADPFLQVKLLRLLQALGHKNDEASEAMNDVLAQVATNTETNRNAGNAILYECVRAIMTVESESGLRVLAVNILGRFLLNRDNNIRYVALNSLSKVVTEDVAAVQRHRATILDCLKDPDVSIRQRALELTYQLVNPQNAQELVREMLNYLVVATGEHRAHLCGRVATVVDKYAPSAKWQIDVLVAMLSIAGNHCDDSVASSTVAYVCVADAQLQAFVTHKLFHLLRDELPQVQIALMHVAVWCIGEFGEALLSDCAVPADEAGDGLAPLAEASNAEGGADDSLDAAAMGPRSSSGKANGAAPNKGAAPNATPVFSGAVLDSIKRSSYEAIPVAEILGLLEAVLKSHLATVQTKSYVLTALAKLAAKLPEGRAETAELVAQYTSSMAVELQQRSCEYGSLLDDRWAAVRPEALARMPALDLAAVKSKQDETMAVADGGVSPTVANGAGSFSAPVNGAGFSAPAADALGGLDASPAAVSQPAAGGPSLLDLDDIFGGGGGGAPAVSSQPAAVPAVSSQQPMAAPAPPPAADVDLLSDIFAATPSGGAPPAQPPPAAAPVVDIFGGGGGAQTSTPMAPPVAPRPTITAFEKDGLVVTMDVSRADPSSPTIDVLCAFKNSTPKDMERLVFQAAVPKYIQMEMKPASSALVPAGSDGDVTQLVRVTNTVPTKPLMMRLKIRYVVGGRQIEHTGQVSSFPPV